MQTGCYSSELTSRLSSEEMAQLLELVHDCTSCTDKVGLDGALGKLSVLVPLEFYTCLFSQHYADGIDAGFEVVTTNYPDEWARIYFDRGYHLTDPIMNECLEKTGLRYWEEIYGMRPADPAFLSAAREYGLVNGYAAGFKNLSGIRRGVISLSGDGLTKTSRNDLILETVMPHLYLAMDRAAYRQRLEVIPTISPREREVLKWVMHGKTTWETSVIIGISERTVKFHVNNVMKKLNASTRTQAVAIAADLRLIEAC